MKYQAADHTFTICAYQESAFLEKCILSLMAQTVRTNVIMVTSTPNAYIKALADQYHIPLYINEQGVKYGSNISNDWNFALSKVKTPLATIAHQDDLYKETYAEKILEAANRCENPLILFSDYSEIREDTEVTENKLLKIKRTILSPLKDAHHWKSVFWRRRVLSIGSAICCPSITYCLSHLSLPVFTKGFRSNMDWEAEERISRLPGEFVYLNEILMSHRIHEGSTTTKVITEEGRGGEDLAMFEKFWPHWMAVFIESKYRSSEDQNSLHD